MESATETDANLTFSQSESGETGDADALPATGVKTAAASAQTTAAKAAFTMRDFYFILFSFYPLSPPIVRLPISLSLNAIKSMTIGVITMVSPAS